MWNWLTPAISFTAMAMIVAFSEVAGPPERVALFLATVAGIVVTAALLLLLARRLRRWRR